MISKTNQRISRQIGIHLQKEEWDQARLLINQAEEKRSVYHEPPLDKDSSLLDAGIDTVTSGLLEKARILTVREFLSLPRRVLRQVDGISDARIKKVLKRLKSKGLTKKDP
jgi:hypothetical protein